MKYLIGILFTPSYPVEPVTLEALIPLVGDDLGLAGAEPSPGMHLRAWRR